MCLTCNQHISENLERTPWYCDPKNHKEDWGPIRNLLEKVMTTVVTTGVDAIAQKKEPWKPVMRTAMNWTSYILETFQVLPTLNTAFEVVDLARYPDVALTTCHCMEKEAAEGVEMGDISAWRCLAIGPAAKYALTGGYGGQDFQRIGKEEAKELIAACRKAGFMATVSLKRPSAAWMCNCGPHCGARKTTECPWTMAPSIVVAYAPYPESCAACGTCTNICPRGAQIRDRNTQKVVAIDESKCWGCMLCVENCPNKVLGAKPRELVLDPTKGRRVGLWKEEVLEEYR